MKHGKHDNRMGLPSRALNVLFAITLAAGLVPGAAFAQPDTQGASNLTAGSISFEEVAGTADKAVDEGRDQAELVTTPSEPQQDYGLATTLIGANGAAFNSKSLEESGLPLIDLFGKKTEDWTIVYKGGEGASGEMPEDVVKVPEGDESFEFGLKPVGFENAEHGFLGWKVTHDGLDDVTIPDSAVLRGMRYIDASGATHDLREYANEDGDVVLTAMWDGAPSQLEGIIKKVEDKRAESEEELARRTAEYEAEHLDDPVMTPNGRYNLGDYSFADLERIRIAADETYAELASPDTQFEADHGLKLLVRNPGAIRAGDVILSEGNGTYLLAFPNEEALESALEHYRAVSEFTSVDGTLAVAEGETPLTAATAGNLASIESDFRADDTTIALIDTGVADDADVIARLSVLDDGTTADVNGHGSRMLGYMREVDPNAKVVSIKAVGDDGVASASAVYAGIKKAMEMGCGYINLSMSARAIESNGIVARAIREATAQGVTVVGAAGNNGLNAANYIPGGVEEAIVAGATENHGFVLESSNYGDTVDVYAEAASTSEASARVCAGMAASGLRAQGLDYNELRSSLTNIGVECYLRATYVDPDGDNEDALVDEDGNFRVALTSITWLQDWKPIRFGNRAWGASTTVGSAALKGVIYRNGTSALKMASGSSFGRGYQWQAVNQGGNLYSFQSKENANYYWYDLTNITTGTWANNNRHKFYVGYVSGYESYAHPYVIIRTANATTYSLFSQTTNGLNLANSTAVVRTSPNSDGSSYCHWAISACGLAITYSANGGSGTASSVNPMIDEQFTLPSSGFSRTGYDWKGWSYGSSSWSAGATIYASAISTSTGSVTLNAVWQAKTYTQTIYYRYQNADGSYGSYSSTTGTGTYNQTFTKSFSQTATYQAASVSYTCTGTATKYVDIPRKTATATVRYRLQNADGSWGGYTNGVSATTRVGASQSYTYSQTATHQAASGTATIAAASSATGSPSAVTTSIDVYRKTATATVYYQLENADGSWAAAATGGSATTRVGATYSWSRAQDATYQAASGTTGAVAAASSATGSPANVSTTIKVYRKTATLTCRYRYQNADGTWPSSYTTAETPTLRVGQSHTHSVAATGTYKAASGSVTQPAATSATGNPAAQTISLDISRQSYTLTINPNGGTWGGTTTSSTATQLTGSAKSIPAPTRAGYTFVGWAEVGSGSVDKLTNSDPAFESSNGGNSVYNNSGGSGVTHTFATAGTGALTGGRDINIAVSTAATSPGLGGFVQNTQSAAGKKYIHAFVAKIPVGYSVQWAANAGGNERSVEWLTPTAGTGAYETYAYQYNCGTTGTFSTFGHVYIVSGSKPMSWQLNYSSMFDVTSGKGCTYTYGAGAGTLVAMWAPNKYNQTVRVHYENAAGQWTNSSGTVNSYDTVINADYFYNTSCSWSRAQDATYQAASLSAYTVTQANTKDVYVYRKTATATVRYRLQNADGSWSGYTNGVSAATRVGGSQTYTYNQTNTYQQASGTATIAAATSATGTPSNVTVDIDVPRKLASVIFQYRLQNADGTYPSGYTAGYTSANMWVGQSATWTTSADTDTYSNQTATGAVAVAPSATANPDNVTVSIDVPRRTATDTIRARYQNADGTYGEYSVVAQAVKRVGEVLSWARAADGTYVATSGSITGTKDAQTLDLDVKRRFYGVQFDGNGATTGSMSPMLATNAAPVMLPSNEFARTGYRFKEWLATTAPDTLMYAPTTTWVNQTAGNTFSTFKVQVWKDGNYIEQLAGKACGETGLITGEYTPSETGTYTIRYGKNGSTTDYCDEKTVNLTAGITYQVSAWVVENTVDKGTALWVAAAEKSSSTDTYGNATTMTRSGEGTVVLSAQWDPNTYTVAYDGNGATSGSTPSTAATYGTAAHAAPCGYVRTGYKFTGWNTAADGTGTTIAVGGDLLNLTDEHQGTVTLFAKWEPISYIIHFDAAGGTGTVPADIATTYDTPVTMPDADLVKDGRGLAGWTPVAPMQQNGGQGSLSTQSALPVQDSAEGHDVGNVTAEGGDRKQDGSFPFVEKAYADEPEEIVYYIATAVKNLTATDESIVTLYAVYEKPIKMPMSGMGGWLWPATCGLTLIVAALTAALSRLGASKRRKARERGENADN